MGKFKVIYDKNSCIGAGACVVLSPDIFQPSDDGKVNLLGARDLGNEKFELITNSKESILEAAESCPVQAIKVIDLDTEKELI